MRAGMIVSLAGSALVWVGAAAVTPADAAAVGVPSANADAASRLFEAAQFRKDRATLDRFLAPGFVLVHASGRVGGRADFMTAFADPAISFTAFDITHRSVIPITADGAVVAAEAVVTGTRAGAAFRQHFRYADTYVRTDGRWRVVYTQVTTVKD